MKRQQHNNTQTNFAFKILYGLCLCLTVLALSDQLKLYEQKKAVSAANIQLSDTSEIKRLALTFDDGPHPSYTEKLLDGLKERGIKATFLSQANTQHFTLILSNVCTKRDTLLATIPTAIFN